MLLHHIPTTPLRCWRNISLFAQSCELFHRFLVNYFQFLYLKSCTLMNLKIIQIMTTEWPRFPIEWGTANSHLRILQDNVCAAYCRSICKQKLLDRKTHTHTVNWCHWTSLSSSYFICLHYYHYLSLSLWRILIKF